MIERLKCFMPGLAQAWAPRHKMLSRVASLFLCLVVLFSCIPFEVSAASSESNYWYNGVELPPLPFDSTPDKFFIIKSSSGDIRLYGTLSSGSNLYTVPNATYGQILRYNVDGSYGSFDYYKLSDSGWEQVANPSGVPYSSIVYSNTDIFNEDFTDVIYSSNSFPLPYSQREIYSYGGYLAPDVFYNWGANFTNYPNFCIIRDINTNSYSFFASASPVIYNPVTYNSTEYTYDFLIPGHPNGNTNYAYFKLYIQDGIWFSDSFTYGGTLFERGKYELIWSSVDVINEEDNSVYMKGSEAVPLGNLTSLYTVLPEDDVWEVKQGGSKRFELASGQNLPVETVTWQLKGNIVSGTSIDYTGLLTVSSNQPLGTIYVVASNINGEGYSSKAAVTVLPEQTASTDWVIRSNYTGTFYSGNDYTFYLYNPSTSQSGASAVWSIYSPNTLSSGTTISASGVLTVASDQGPAEITIQASSINGEDEYSTYTIFVFTSGTGGGGDTPTPTPTPTPGAQDVIDSIDEGFTGLGNKLDNLGDTLIGGLLEGLLRLFVPTSEELTNKMNEFAEWLNLHFPILAIPLEFVTYSYNLFFGVTPELGLLDFPQISWMDNVLIEEHHLDLTQYEWLDTILPIIRTTLTAAACYAFAHWIIKKVKEVGSL